MQLANRALHLKIHPRPANLAESREVLRMLQTFGDVVMFKSLKVSNRSLYNHGYCAINREAYRY